ncbi:MAG TPA: FHA domain-containing protein [Blastocatellia bacterium]|nr:FHA domain-containing protein [Blastocatellia bacterium]
MIRCHNCRTDNLDGSEYCDECGVRLHATPEDTATVAVQSPVPTLPPMNKPDPIIEPQKTYTTGPDLVPPEPAFVRTTETPRPVVPSPPPVVQAPPPVVQVPPPVIQAPPPPVAPPQASQPQPVVDYSPPPPPRQESDSRRPAANQSAASAPSSRASEPTSHLDNRGSGTESLRNSPQTSSGARAHAKLVISRGGSIGKEFPISGPEAQIGRWDADNGIFPDIDLDQHDPEAKVSRRHARVIVESGQYMVEDLGSTNGTFVNRGRRLIPGKRQPLRSGDELIIGKTFLKFIVEN